MDEYDEFSDSSQGDSEEEEHLEEEAEYSIVVSYDRSTYELECTNLFHSDFENGNVYDNMESAFFTECPLTYMVVKLYRYSREIAYFSLPTQIKQDMNEFVVPKLADNASWKTERYDYGSSLSYSQTFDEDSGLYSIELWITNRTEYDPLNTGYGRLIPTGLGNLKPRTMPKSVQLETSPWWC